MTGINHKSITFFYDQPVAREAMIPIADEASSRGYDTSFSEDLSKEADIGIYAEHTDRISSINADLSCKMFHGIDEGFEPGWYAWESWGHFDLGFVPGQVFATEWRAQSWHPQARPQTGVFIVGWPKSDLMFNGSRDAKIGDGAAELNNTSGLKILYAPSGTTSDRKKIADLLDSTADSTDLILIKHHPSVSEQIPDALTKRVADTENVHVIDKHESIIEYLHIADVVVSEESSVLSEALLTETVPISVTNWPIGSHWDRSHEHIVPEITIKTTRDELAETLDKIRDNYEAYRSDIVANRSDYFSYLGSASERTVDVIDNVVASGGNQLTPVEPDRNLNIRRSYIIFEDYMNDKLGETTKKRLKKIGIGDLKSFIERRVV